MNGRPSVFTSQVCIGFFSSPVSALRYRKKCDPASINRPAYPILTCRDLTTTTCPDSIAITLFFSLYPKIVSFIDLFGPNGFLLTCFL